MNSRRWSVPALSALVVGYIGFTAPTARAQVASASIDAATLARYDTNHNGVLDPDELARMRADQASAAQAGTAVPADQAAPNEDVVKMSPFQVDASQDKGYYAENTLAGSRIKTNLADLAASITVVTKQQMEDTASVDINDVFRYEANTEGSRTYTPSVVDRGTAKDTIAGYSFGNNGDLSSNATSNRVRGLTAPDAAINNYPSNARIPFDVYNTASVEITRGPNSLLFGLGTPAGVVNQNTTQAAINKNTGVVNGRTDQNGSYRSYLTINRTLIADKLAVFGAILYDNEQFERKPSRDLYRRQYGSITFKPFKNTTIRGFAENYRNDANRPNFLMPRDWVTPWLENGRPYYDPVTRTVTVQSTGRVLGPYVNSNQSPGYNPAVNTIIGTGALTTTTSPLYVPGIAFDDVGRPIRLIDNGQSVAMFQRNPTVSFPPQFTYPVTANQTPASLGFVPQDPRYAILDRMWTASAALPQPTTTINGVTYTYGSWQNPEVTNPAIYDWRKYNLLQANFGQTKAQNYNVEFEQQILPSLFFSAGWFRQDIEEWDNFTINQLQASTISVDTNKNFPDGTPNPYFGLPFVYEGIGGGLDTFHLPETDDNYRAMLAYDLDLRNEPGWKRWIGRQRVLGMWSEQDVYKQTERWRMNFVDGDMLTKLLYTFNPMQPGVRQALSSPGSSATMRHFYLANPGDPAATVTHSTGFYGNQGWQGPVASTVRVWNPATNQFENHPIVEQTLFLSAGTFPASQREVKSRQLALQSYFWEDRLITTLGWRHDDYRARIATDGIITDEQNQQVAPAIPDFQRFTNGYNGVEDLGRLLHRWNHWDRLSGDTKTLGGAFRPFQNLGFVERIGNRFASEFLNGLTFYFNKSDNFNPPLQFQTDMFGNRLPKPSGEGKDIGIGVSLLGNKLVARLNWYETKNINERTTSASTLLTRAAYPDTTLGIPWAAAVTRIRRAEANGMTLQQIANTPNWNSDSFINLSSETDQRALYDMIKLPYLYYAGISAAATQQSKADGYELQITYNPVPNWTMKVTGSKNRASYTNVAPEYDAWVATRMPVWTTLTAPDIPDFTGYLDQTTTGRFSLSNFWAAYGYSGNARYENTNGNTSTQAYFNNNIQSIVATSKALEGAMAPELRQYHGTFLTNYTFPNESFGGRLRGFAVGGAESYESKAVIGYYGKVGNPTTQPTVINVSDVSRPVYDNGNFYTDLWISYSTKIWRNKVGLKVQLNCNNVFEGGRLEATQVNFDGTPWAYRIIDPRQWILQATFTF